ncbi:thioredoxin family protein [Pseudooceanicola sp. CBS1P-1]|uniref:Thioredoxin domain-containing protein n=1 Tax=Pseudooceanicola albus TaxID=2692189 RepID=A0A6L7G7A9_9RHOB|nr:MULTISPECIES: thioredoxin family protein [Pseudooceanicola]MBT9384071.1 thioredoxin family protein [Pseudooceanicola endophyticus]MXN19829.1 hypothetical protein [Pseudooceanicola albus]
MKRLLLPALMGLLATPALAAVTQVNEAGDFDAQVIQPSQQGYVLAAFMAPSCKPCEAEAEVLDKVAAERKDVTVVNVDALSLIAQTEQYKVNAMPTFVLFHGGKPGLRTAGYMDQKAFDAWLDQSLPK